MTLNQRLSPIQLEIVMHLANGMTIEEIANEMSYSPSNINRHCGRARRAAHAKTLPHLVSIAIGCGVLVWDDEEHTRYLEESDPAGLGLSASHPQGQQKA